ncbi:MAG: HigA family addiction module antidote protein [Candidatus Lambdaproteobacteria bacterium]|nr:HigA family addiction module antidote protein [Candidatus Lambdaproteobacteria bacterium]
MAGKSTTSNTTEPAPLRMHNPPHPGEVLRDLCLEPLGLTVAETARAIGVSRTALSQFVNGHTRLSLDMARRLAAAFRTSPESWLNLQHAHDLWRARKDRTRLRVRPLVARKAAG